MGTTGFNVRLIGALLISILLCAGGTALVWVSDHQRRLDAAVSAHAGFVLSELRAALEARLNLGLALPELPQVGGLLESAGADLPGLQSIAVVDEAGRIVFSTDAVEVGETVREFDPWPDPDAAAEGIWTFRSVGGTIFGISLSTSFDTTAGAVVLRVASGAIAERVSEFALTLGLQSTAVAAVAGILGTLGVLLLARPQRHAARRLTGLLEDVVAAPANPPAAGGGPDGSAEVPPPIAGFAHAVRSRMGVLERADREVTRLDELA